MDVFEHPVVVTPSHIDRWGHANNLAYVAWMQDAAVAHSAALGWDAERYERSGIGWVVRSHEITYLQPAFAEQALVVRTWIADMKRVTSLRRYEIIRTADATLLAKAATQWALVEFPSGKLRRISAEIAESFKHRVRADHE